MHANRHFHHVTIPTIMCMAPNNDTLRPQRLLANVLCLFLQLPTQDITRPASAVTSLVASSPARSRAAREVKVVDHADRYVFAAISTPPGLQRLFLRISVHRLTPFTIERVVTTSHHQTDIRCRGGKLQRRIHHRWQPRESGNHSRSGPQGNTTANRHQLPHRRRHRRD